MTACCDCRIADLVEAALVSFFAPDNADQRAGVFNRRLDRLSRQLDRLERDQTIGLETLALLVRYFLTVTLPLAEAEQAAARSQGKERYERFIESLGRRLQRGGSPILDLEHELALPTEPSVGPKDTAADVNGRSVLTAEHGNG